MTTSIRLQTIEGCPYNVSMSVSLVDVRGMGETLPRMVATQATFAVETVSFDDLFRIVAVLSPSVTPAQLQDAFRADMVAIVDAIRPHATTPAQQDAQDETDAYRARGGRAR